MKSGRKKLPDDFVYTQHHKSIWNSFCNFFDERLAEEDLGEILDEDEVKRIKTAPTIPPMLLFEPANLGDVETKEEQRARARCQALADKSYAGKEAQHLDGIKKLASKFNRATVLVLKHVDALINLDMHQFLKSDPIKRLDPETKYHRLRQYFSERWGPHTSLDVAKIKSDLMNMQGDNPGWRKYLQNFNCYVGSLEQTAKRDAADQIIYGPAPAPEYPPRPLANAPAADHTTYVAACQLADEIRDAQYPHGGPALNHRPTDAELKTILLDALSASKLRAYQTLYQQYCNRSHNGKTYLDLYNDIHDLVKYESDGIKSSTRDSEAEDSDASRSTRGSSRSSNSHSSRRNAQIAAAANHLQQVADNTSANSNILYQQSSGKHQGTSPNNPGRGPQAPCKNCKSTKHSTKWCTSTKCFEPNCGRTFATAEERKTHFINEHGTIGAKSSPQKTLKSALKDGNRKPKVKFSKAQRMVSLANRVQRDLDAANQSAEDSEVSSESSMSVDHAPKSLVWKGNSNRISYGRKVSKIHSVSTILRKEESQAPVGQDSSIPADDSDEDDGPPPLCTDSSDDEDDGPPSLGADSEDSSSDEDDGPPPLCEDEDSSDDDIDAVDKSEPKDSNNPRRMPTKSTPHLDDDGNPLPPGQPEYPMPAGWPQPGAQPKWLLSPTVTKEYWETFNAEETLDPNRRPKQCAKLGPQLDEVHANKQAAEPTTTWDWQHRTAQPREPTAPVKGPEPTQPVKGPEPPAPMQEGTYCKRSSPSPSEYKSDTVSTTDISDNHLNCNRFSAYARYRLAGGRMKYRPVDIGTEDYYARWPTIIFEDGDWSNDFNNLAPSEHCAGAPNYVEWYRSVHPKPTTIRESIRNWLDRRQQLARRQACVPGTYEAHLQDNGRGVQPRADGRDPDIWDDGALYRSHMTRKQAAMDLERTAGTDGHDSIFVNDQDIDNYLIWCDHKDNGIHAPRPELQPRDCNPTPTREKRPRTAHDDRDWDFFYRSLTGPSTNVMPLLNSIFESAKPGTKSNIRTLKTAPLSERIRQNQHNLRKQAHKQRMVNAIFDTGAQVTTMPESAVNRMPSAHNHRDAPPGTAVKYGNGEIETIESLVDIGHFEVQVTPDNCSTSLISVDQIVQDGHTVTFSATETIITDDSNRYRLAYPRVPDSREWVAPMRAMEDITRMREEHPRQYQSN